MARCFPRLEAPLPWIRRRKDRFGLPKARVDVRYGENERKLFAAMRSESRRILEASGVEILDDWTEPRTNHELGGCRMGNDPAKSVVNAFCQSHDIPNLFVVDGSVFPSATEKNPTLTIMALAARTADHIAEAVQRKASWMIVESRAAPSATPLAARTVSFETTVTSRSESLQCVRRASCQRRQLPA